MTIIEFYDKMSVENIVSALLCAPEKVIFVGDNRKKIQRSITLYEEVVCSRGMATTFLYKIVGKNNLNDIIETLTEIVEKNTDCIFDLNGGEELYLVALGMIAQKYPDRIQMHRFNIRNNTLVDCDLEGNVCRCAEISLSVSENIQIYGGKVMFAPEKIDGTYVWEYTEEFMKDVRGMWEICRKNAGRWNTQINAMDRMNSLLDRENFLEVEIDVEQVISLLEKRREKFVFHKEIYEELHDKGIILNWEYSEKKIAFTYKNEQVKKCLTKAGQILEMYITVMAKSVQDETGMPLYNDVQTGVYIDWDGEVVSRDEADVTNEIDVLLMKGLVPVFISCKNGFIEYEELYKLSVVAGRFGGRYVKKVLVASGLDRMGMKAEYIRARAKDMNIRIVEDVDEMSEENLCRILKSLWIN